MLHSVVDTTLQCSYTHLGDAKQKAKENYKYHFHVISNEASLKSKAKLIIDAVTNVECVIKQLQNDEKSRKMNGFIECICCYLQKR